MALTQVPVSMVDFSVNPTLSGGTANGVAYLNGSKVVTTGSALTFDGTTLGVGIAGSAWDTLKAVDLGSGGAVYGTAGQGGITANAYYGTSGFVYKATNGASIYQLVADSHRWSTAASGTGGTGITFTEGMRLNSTGLGIGTSSPGAKLHSSKADGGYVFAVSGTTKGMRVSTDANQTLLQGVDNTLTGSYQPLTLGGSILLFQTNGTTEAMRLDSSGNLGIGTSSPSPAGSGLHIRGAANQVAIKLENPQARTFQILSNGSTGGGGAANGSLAIYDDTAGADRLVLSASGNLGLGVTPSAWNSVLKAVAVGRAGSNIFGQTSANLTGVTANAIFDSSDWKYVTSDNASRYQQNSGVHSWYNAPSGTAGNAISFTQAMTLDASGNLGVGTTSPSTRLHASNSTGSVIVKAERTSPAGSFFQGFEAGSSGALIGRFGHNNDLVPLFCGTTSNHALGFYTNDTERARITSGGEVYIAGTTDQGAYNLQVNGTGVWGAGAYVNGSDANLKEEVQDLAPALDVIASLRPVTFRYKEDYSKDQNVQPGFIAQELQTAMAGQAYVDGVIQSGPQHLNVAYQSLIPLLTKAIQELKAEFDAYKATHP